MTHLRASFRTLMIPMAVAGLLVGCDGEPAPATPAASSTPAPAPTDSKGTEAKVPGGKRDIMDGIPKK